MKTVEKKRIYHLLYYNFHKKILEEKFDITGIFRSGSREIKQDPDTLLRKNRIRILKCYKTRIRIRQPDIYISIYAKQCRCIIDNLQGYILTAVLLWKKSEFIVHI